MIKFFRHIRKNLLMENKTGSSAVASAKAGKYFKYAIGEIILVVIGILIALQINNWNEAQKDQAQVITYKRLIKEELKEDLKILDFLQVFNDSIRSLISDYLKEYNASEPNIEKLKQMNISEAIVVNTFNKNSFTIDEVANNGFLSVFSPEIKLAIVKLKEFQDLFAFYEREAFLRVIKSFDRREEHIDVLYEIGYSAKPHPTATQWYEDLASENYRHLNNSVAKTLEYYDYQENTVFKRIKERTTHLLELLEE